VLYQVSGLSIPAEHRAITVAQLQGVMEEVHARCGPERWTDWNGKALAPASVCLYDLNHYLIMPKTVPHGVRLTWVDPLPDALCKGVRLRQVPCEGARCRAEGLIMDADPATSSVLVEVQVGCFGPAEASEFSIAGSEGGVPGALGDVEVEPLSHVSYVGTLTSSPQRPDFFISHWWGEPVMDFVSCVTHHAQVRGLSDGTAYWCCAYANDQHDLGADVTEDPTASSFCRALMDENCKGVLLVLNAPGQGSDQPGVPFTRIWCAFEIFMAMSGQLPLVSSTPSGAQRKQLLLDIITADENGVQLLTDGLTAKEQIQEDSVIGRGHLVKMEREDSFPLEMIRAAMQVELEKAQASVEQDRRHILNLLAGMRDIDAEPPEQHEHFDAANAKLRAIFALASWARVTSDGFLEVLGLPQVLRGDRNRRQLSLTLSGSLQQDRDLDLLAAGLPEGLHVLVLNLNSTPLTDRGLKALASQLPTQCPELRQLQLHLWSTAVGDAGAEALFASLQKMKFLEDARTYFRNLSGISRGTFAALGAFLGSSRTLQKLCVAFGQCEAVEDDCLADLAKCFPEAKALRTLRLSCTGCSVSDKGVLTLGKAVARLLPELQHVRMTFVQTKATRVNWDLGKPRLRRLLR